MKSVHRGSRVLSALTFLLVSLIIALAVAPGPGVWRLPVGALAAVLALELHRRSRPSSTAGRGGPPTTERRPLSLLSTGLFSELIDRDYTVNDGDCMSRLERLDFTSLESQVKQSHTFAGCSKHRALHGVTHRLHS